MSDEHLPPGGEDEPGEVYQAAGEDPQGFYTITWPDGSVLKALGRWIEVSYDVGDRRVRAIYEPNADLEWVLMDIDWAD